MKRFDDLTNQQKVVAILTAEKDLRDCLQLGIIVTDTELSKSEIEDLAAMAAEESDYNDDGVIIIPNKEFDDSYFRGGCL